MSIATVFTDFFNMLPSFSGVPPNPASAAAPPLPKPDEGHEDFEGMNLYHPNILIAF